MFFLKKKASRYLLITFILIMAIVCSMASLAPFVSVNTFSGISVFALFSPYLFIVAVVLFFGLLKYFKRFNIIVLFFLFVITIFAYGLRNSVTFNYGDKYAKNENVVNVMTWNVAGFGNKIFEKAENDSVRTGIFKVLGKYKPDILCLQEYEGFAQNGLDLERSELMRLGYKYVFISNDSVIFKNKYKYFLTKGVAIFSIFPILDSGRININKIGNNENAIYLDLLVKGKPMRVMTAHFLSFGLYSGDISNNGDSVGSIEKSVLNIKKFFLTTSIHEKQASLLNRCIENCPYPVIFCGDINTTPAMYAYNKLRGNLKDAFLEKGRGVGVTFYKHFYPLRIDVCFVCNKLNVISCVVPHVYYSDHYPVFSEIGW